MSADTWTHLSNGQAVAVLLIAGGVLFFAARGMRAVARRLQQVDTADLLTYTAAIIATGVSAQGMWRFTRDVLDFPVEVRIGAFAFIEVAVLASAVRARRSVRRNGGRAGVDGAAVWGLTALSAVLSALHAASFAEVVFRLAAPLVAAWLWERSLGDDRVERTGRRGRINWALSPERVLVLLGLAEATGRTTEQAEVERRLAQLARSAHRARVAGEGRRAWWARRRLQTAQRAAITHTSVATDREQQALVLRHLAVLGAADTLITAQLPSPWGPLAAELGALEIEQRAPMAERPELDALLDEPDPPELGLPDQLSKSNEMQEVPEPALGDDGLVGDTDGELDNPPVTASAPRPARLLVRPAASRAVAARSSGDRSSKARTSAARSVELSAEVVDVGREVAERLAGEGTPLTHRSLMAGFRARGLSLSSDRCAALLRQLRPAPTT